ncbi:MAG TPA: CarD family transcriptional regulator, partial [Trueperaceae bacterium]
MPQTALQTRSKRLLGLPAVARLATFARHDGPAVLITTNERLELYREPGVFGSPASINPGLAEWTEKRDKVVLGVAEALRAFPTHPESYALRLELGRELPRDELLTRLTTYGYERDGMPGFVVKGDTLTVYLEEDEPEASLRLEFFGDELDAMTLRGKPAASFTLAPRENSPATSGAQGDWDSRLLEHLPGLVFLDGSELYPGDLAEAGHAEWLWRHLAEREVVSFGRDPLDVPEDTPGMQPLGYYRGKLSEFAADAETWLKDDYSVTLLLRFERTGRYLREHVLDHLDAQWTHGVRPHPGVLGMSVSGRTQGGYRDPERREVVLTEELLYGYQGTRKLKRLPGKRVADPIHLTVGDYLIHPDHGIGRFQGLEPREVVGVTRDYLILQYAGEGRLYLPVEQLPLLRRHPGTTDEPPRLSTLGTNEWARAREKARVNAQELAAELIKTYAA